MPRIPFPNVPKSAGVPAIPRSAGIPTVARAVLGVVQGALWRALQVDTRWGIFDSKGKSIFGEATGGIIASLLSTLGKGSTTSVSAVEYSKEVRSSDFPVEKGSFANYNKVEAPGTPSVTMAMDGSEADRKKFLEAIDKACKSTDLYSVVTPEAEYLQHSLERYSYQRRSQHGLTLLIVEIALKEVRQVSAQYAKTEKAKEPAAAPPVEQGKVQPQAPEQSTLKATTNKINTPSPNDATATRASRFETMKFE